MKVSLNTKVMNVFCGTNSKIRLNKLFDYMLECSIKQEEIFKLLKKWADLKDKDMYSTFNMGVGLTFVVKEDDRDKVLDFFKDSDLKLYELGKVVAGEDKIELSF